MVKEGFDDLQGEFSAASMYFYGLLLSRILQQSG